jgi:hypothetical protein
MEGDAMSVLDDPAEAEKLLKLLEMMADLDRGQLGFMVGHMAAQNVDLAIEAFGVLMTTTLPPEASLPPGA